MQGTYRLKFVGSGNLDFVSASARVPSSVRVWYGAELIEDVYVGAYSPHTWWGGNSLMGRVSPVTGGVLTIEVGPDAKVRIEGDLEAV